LIGREMRTMLGSVGADGTIADGDLRAFIETLPQIVWRATPAGESDFYSRRWYDYTGLTAEESLGRKWLAAVHPDDRAHVSAAWDAAVRDAEPYDLEFRIVDRDGRARWFLVRGMPLRDATAAVVHWCGTCIDIHELHGAAARDAFLARADELFAVELEPEAIVRAVAEAAVESFADYVLFDLATEDGTLRRAAVEHRDPQRREPFLRSVGQTPPLGHPVHPIAVAWRSGESVIVPRIDETWWKRAAADDAHYARMRDEGLSSLVTVLMTARGRRYGALTFCRTGASPNYGDLDLATAENLAHRIGAALENARLFREARDAVDAQRRIAASEAFYARLGESLAETLDLRDTLQAATRLLVPLFADWATVNLIDPDGALFLAASHHRDPELAARANELLDVRYLVHDAPTGSPAVVRTKKAAVYGDLPQGALAAVGTPYRETVRALAVVSAAIVPIAYGGSVRGTLALMYDATSDRRYHASDLRFVEEVARRIAPAIANAEAYERERRVAHTFQAAALTTDLPRVAGMSFDALYEAGRSDALIGGDWYDAFRVPDGRVVVSVGDVAGSGLDAAATMAAIRQSLRGAAAINPDPSVMLDAADRVLRSQAPERFVTAWVGVIDPVWATLAYAGAGHPPPLMRMQGSRVVEIAAAGLPLGLRERGQDVTRHADLADDVTLLLYTDGLVEAERDLIRGAAALVQALREADPVAAPAQAIHDAVLHGAAASDDVAMLVVDFQRSLLAIGGDRGALHWAFDARSGRDAGASREALVAALARRGIGKADRTISELIFAELVGNTKRYAPGLVDVALDLSGESAVLHVVDRGGGFQHNARLPADALAESGRGLFIVSTIAEEFAVTRCPDGGAHARAVLKGRLD
jgi:PAS domain S-box-containing protein